MDDFPHVSQTLIVISGGNMVNNGERRSFLSSYFFGSIRLNRVPDFNDIPTRVGGKVLCGSCRDYS